MSGASAPRGRQRRALDGLWQLASAAPGSTPADSARLDWIDALIPDLAAHLGKQGNGALLIGSKNADLNAQIVTVSDAGAVSLQHMWGY